MIDVQSIDSVTKSHMNVRVVGVPEHKADYMDRMIQPDHVLIDYIYRAVVNADGWTEHIWATVSVQIVGARVLKPGPGGAQRLGKDRHDARWSNFTERGELRPPTYSTALPMPGWLANLIKQMRPSGDVALPGGAQ